MTNTLRPLRYDQLIHLLPGRSAASHKGDFGHLLVVGGDQGMGGAVVMAAEAAARTGSGLVSVATHHSHAMAFISRRPELMTTGLEDIHVINVLGERANALVLGPGLGRSIWSEAVFASSLVLAGRQQLPMVLDADGLNLLASGTVAADPKSRSKWILTPHAGETARLLQTTREAIEGDREAAVRALQSKYGGVTLLKGAGTLVCYMRGKRQLVDTCQHGNPGMASGGMGDILSGILGGLLAQGLSPVDATRLGVCLHSLAADKAAEQGQRGMLATDLLEPLRGLLNP